MSSPVYHAESSARLFGGHPDDYLALHFWFDASKVHFPNFRHRAVRHHSAGIAEAEQIFGPYLIVKEGGRERRVPTRIVAETHIVEDCGRVPTLAEWLSTLQAKPWMRDGRRVERRLDVAAEANR